MVTNFDRGGTTSTKIWGQLIPRNDLQNLGLPFFDRMVKLDFPHSSRRQEWFDQSKQNGENS